jgi:mannose-6-phosphate isomerase-like protein (cupin superfamily)
VQMIRPSQFTGTSPWQAIDIERIDCATVRLHWTDAPYKWHVNDGPEVFAVLSGEVNMRTRDKDGEKVWHLRPGDIFHVDPGDEHLAKLIGATRILVVERTGSV